jgi:hypothetical protein
MAIYSSQCEIFPMIRSTNHEVKFLSLTDKFIETVVTNIAMVIIRNKSEIRNDREASDREKIE